MMMKPTTITPEEASLLVRPIVDESLKRIATEGLNSIGDAIVSSVCELISSIKDGNTKPLLQQPQQQHKCRKWPSYLEAKKELAKLGDGATLESKLNATNKFVFAMASQKTLPPTVVDTCNEVFHLFGMVQSKTPDSEFKKVVEYVSSMFNKVRKA